MDEAVGKAEAAFRSNPGDLNAAAALASVYAQQGRTADVVRIADTLLNNPQADVQMISFAAQVYQQVVNYPRLEQALQRWSTVAPTPELLLDYAAVQAVQGKGPPAIVALRQALALSNERLKTNDKAENLAKSVPNDLRFASLKVLPEFQQLLATNK